MKAKSDVITVIDVGTTKIVCLVAVIDQNGNLRVIGASNFLSKGIKAGIITDLRQAEISIISAIETAEKAAGVNIDRALISLTGIKISSKIIESHINISGHSITDKDISRLISLGLEQNSNPTQEIIHSFPLEYSLDGQSGIKDPISMYGNQLSCKTHIITAPSNLILNIANCMARCQIDIEDFMVSSYASALACINEDEKELGAIVIDMGGTTTSITVFNDGNLTHIEYLPIGGTQITSDIAQGLSIKLSEAERIKILYGDAISNSFESNMTIELNHIGEDNSEGEPLIIKLRDLSDILRPRLEEILEMVKSRIDLISNSKMLSKRIILTGGTSQIIGLKKLASHILQGQVRIGSPKVIYGLSEHFRGPIFSAAVGMLEYAAAKNFEQFKNMKNQNKNKMGLLKKIFSWT